MSRLAAALVALAVAGLAPAPAGAEPDAWQAWEYVRRVDLAEAPPEGLTRVALPAELVRGLGPQLRDLRVIDDDDREVPYVLDTSGARGDDGWRRATLTDTGTVPGSYSQAVLDVGEDAELHDLLELELEEDDFLARVEVAASPDAAAWRVVADGLPIYRSRETGLNGSTRVRYPETRDRWLRVRVSGETPLVIAGARVCHRPERPTDRIVVAAGGAEAPVEDSISAWRLDAGGPTPVSAVRVETSSPRFHRPLEVRASDDGEAWRRIGDGQIYRYPDGEPPVLRERLLVEFPSARGRFFEVRIHDGDDPALAELGVEVHSHRRHVVFPRRSGRSYRLVYGNPRAPAPEYDLGRTVRTADLTAAAPAAVGPELRNPDYRSGEPWSERHPWVLWSALGLAAGALAWAAWRVMR